MKKLIILLWICMWYALIPAYGASPVRIACLGDSITAGMLVRKEDCWVSRVAKALGKKAEVGNFGVSARCLLFKGDRPITREKAYRDALAFKPGMLLIGLGTNDSKEVNWKHKTDFADNYKEVIAEFRKENPRLKVYCLLPIPSQGRRHQQGAHFQGSHSAYPASGQKHQFQGDRPQQGHEGQGGPAGGRRTPQRGGARPHGGTHSPGSQGEGRGIETACRVF